MGKEPLDPLKDPNNMDWLDDSLPKECWVAFSCVRQRMSNMANIPVTHVNHLEVK